MFKYLRLGQKAGRLHLLTVVTLLLALTVSVFNFSAESVSAAGDGYARQIPSGGTADFRATADGSGEYQFPELAGEPRGDAEGGGGGPTPTPRGATQVANRSLTKAKANYKAENDDDAKGAAKGTLNTSFNGLTLRSQRLANGGNQFTVEPPDQGLCANGTYVMESVNDVLRVYDTAGNGLSGVTDLNTFYGYPAAINRTTGIRGPFVTDPSCYFDAPTQRWFQVVLTLETVPTSGAFTGKNHLDVAVSLTSSPLGSWKVYRIPVQNDGTDGTPNNGCSFGPCIGDYPHIGADKNGFYITTNEYSFFGPEYTSSQVYAISKKALAAAASSITVVQFNTVGAVAGNPGFTVIPALSPDSQYEEDAGGTEYFLSSMAAPEANGTGEDNRVAVWAMTNTSSLNSATPNLKLRNTVIKVKTYSIPPPADQKAGDFPLGQCINDTTMPTPFGPGCWQYLFVAEPSHTEVESPLDSSDSRMQQVYFSKHKLWGALGSGVSVGGTTKAGIAYYIIEPAISSKGVKAELARQGQFGLANNNLTYPALAVTSEGKGVMGFTLVGHDYFPSAGFATLNEEKGAGPIQVAAAGLGPQDGFTGYKAEVGDPPRPRWGDYGAAVAVGNKIWLASEYIGQTCTLAQYAAINPATGVPTFNCGATRVTLGNWYTRISQVTP